MQVALQQLRKLIALICVGLILPGQTLLWALDDQQQAAKIPNEQLDSLVAPIALYPDPLLAQSLAASTYPLEVIQLQQFLDKNKNLRTRPWPTRYRNRIGIPAFKPWLRFQMRPS